MILQVFPVMIAELLICTCETSRFTYFLALNVLYNIIETLYTAYYAIGFTTYLFALISYLPFITGIVRMAWRDTETRRLIFYRACRRTWLFAAGVDMWVATYILAEVDHFCEMSKFIDDSTNENLSTFLGVHKVT